VAVRINVERVVGTSLHARLATNAPTGIKINNTIFSLIESCGRTDLDTRRSIAVITTIDKKIAARIGEFATLNVLDPGTVDPDGDIVFRFTGDGTGMTADTLALVDHKGVFGHQCFPLMRNGNPPGRRSNCPCR
jgi:hypothetical protein